MVPTELGRGASVRSAVFNDGTDQALLAAMTANMPSGGITAVKVAGPRRLPPTSNRLLDGRMLETALRFLNEDISEPLLAGLSKYRALTKAARETLANPDQTEVMVGLIEPYQITSTQHPYLALTVDDTEIARVSFEIGLVFGFFETAVAVRRGAIEYVESQACNLAARLSLDGWAQPLLSRQVQLPVRMPVRPPLPIPLPGNTAEPPRPAR